jgi:D-glucuronyl C5-epimerase-like protein
MRRMKAILILLAAAPVCAAGQAQAAPVIDVTAHGARVDNDPALDGPWSLAGPVPGPRPSTASTARAVSITRADPVRRTIQRAFQSNSIDAATRDGYLRSWSAALGTYRRLSGQRRAELGYVIGTIRSLAVQKRLTGRLAPLFLMLDRNREWWAKAGPPASGARLRFGSSRVLFQYFPGEGLQLHPLGNFGEANGFWYAKRDGDLRSLLEDLRKIAVNRGGFLTWEYYFAFGGGAPPWISGMAQGTAMQAYARASQRLSDPTLLEIARRARGAFEQPTPLGVRARQGSLTWYPLYSFGPRLNVLNGMLQAVNGVRTYAEISGDQEAQAIFARGDETARAVIGKYDTGAWSLYDRPNGRPGNEADLNYHTLNRDFAQSLCKATKAEPYCRATEHFTRYLKEDPTFDPYRAVPSPATAGKGVKFRFRLSKISRVGIVVKDASSGKIYLSTSIVLPYGPRWFRWVPPKRRGEHTYTYSLYARDLAGNSASVSGEVNVKGRAQGV